MKIMTRRARTKLFLDWYRQRIEQYLERSELTIEQALQMLRSLPSSELRNKEIDSKVDDHYKVINAPLLKNKNLN